MKDPRITDFKTSGYFSGTIIFVGLILAGAGLILMVLKFFLAAAIFSLIGIIIFTTHYRLTVDLENKAFHDYLWILGIKNGEKGKFEQIEYLFIKKVKLSQKMNSRASSTTIRSEAYDGYLKFSETQKIHLLTNASKAAVVKKLTLIANELNVRIVDYSEGNPQL